MSECCKLILNYKLINIFVSSLPKIYIIFQVVLIILGLVDSSLFYCCEFCVSEY